MLLSVQILILSTKVLWQPKDLSFFFGAWLILYSERKQTSTEKKKEEEKKGKKNNTGTKLSHSGFYSPSFSPRLSLLSHSTSWMYHTVLLVAEVLLHLLQCCLIFDFLWSTMNLTLECAESGGVPSVPRLWKHWVTESNRKQHQFHQNIHIHTVTNRQMTVFKHRKAF